jgi:hypothetical protein
LASVRDCSRGTQKHRCPEEPHDDPTNSFLTH